MLITSKQEVPDRAGKIKTATIFPDDVILENLEKCDVVQCDTTIPCLFAERVKRSPDKNAYSQFDPVFDKWIDYSWAEMSTAVEHWRRAIARDEFVPGDRAAIRLPNSREWVLFDQAVLAQGMVLVPVYVEDRAENISYILEDTGTSLLFLENIAQWTEMQGELSALAAVKRVVILRTGNQGITDSDDPRVISIEKWLESAVPKLPATPAVKPHDLATVVYTSGTTGKPKGVMLSHSNMYLNAYGGLQSVAVYPTDQFLSFLPLSHMFERTVGYYLTMMAGAAVAFNRSIPDLLDDLAEVRPTAMITVPRIFERAYGKILAQLDQGSVINKWLFEMAVEVGWQRFEFCQGRSGWRVNQLFWPILKAFVANKVARRFGGRLRFVVSGGARLPPPIARVFIGLGIEILQGYGLTESSPVLTVNTLRCNKPSSVGLPLSGAELRLGENNELMARGAYIMQGYWNNDVATTETMNPDGWLMTGDIASISEHGFVSITGRIKEIIVLANGEKVPPADLESAIADDPLFEQVMVIGEGKAYLTAIVVLNSKIWSTVSGMLGVQSDEEEALKSEKVQLYILDRIAMKMVEFPGYAFIRKVTPSTELWRVDDGSITPTLKLKRAVILDRFKSEIDQMYNQK